MPRATESPRRPSPPRADEPSFGQVAWHAVGLTALVVATPLCDLAHRFPEFLWAHGLSFAGVVALVACLVLLPPAPLVPLVVAARWGAGSRAGATSGIAIALPILLLALQTAVRAELGGWSVLVGAVALGGFAGAAYLRWRAARSVVTVLSLVALAAPVQLLLATPGSGPGVDAEEPPIVGAVTSAPVVFVIFDELPMVSLLADGERWDGRNFPNFERLASTSHAFLNAHSISAATLVAVPAILSGARPASRLAPSLANLPRNLFTLLGGNHRIFASEAATELCPENLNLFVAATPSRVDGVRRLVSDLWILLQTVSVPQPWSDDLPPIDIAWHDFAGGGALESTGGERDLETRYRELRAAGQNPSSDRGAEFRRFVATIEAVEDATERPTLHFIHTMLPHRPWVFGASGRAYAAADRSRAAGRGKIWSPEAPEMVALGYQRHLLQARYADRLLGELLDRLEATGRFGPSLIVVTADHGASFRPGQPPRDGADRVEALWAPLLIKAPWQAEGRTYRAPLTSVDILPTALDLLGAEPPWPFEGVSALFESADSGDLPKASQAISWKTSVFGEDLDFEPPLRINPYARLIGLETSSFPSAGAGGVELVKLEPSPVLRYDPAASHAPLLVSGTLRRGRRRRDCCDLAFAVNGRIAAVQHTYAGARELHRRFQALLPEYALEAGANELSIHAIRDSGRGVRLALVEPGA